MKLPPLPDGIPLWVQVLLWAALILLGLLGAGLLYFIKRYIDKNDTHHAAVETTLKNHGETFKTLTNRITTEAEKIDKAALDISKANVEFQKDINKELLEIHKTTSDIKSSLTESNSQVGLFKKDITGLMETVENHQKSLSAGAQAMAKQRDVLLKFGSEIKIIKDDLLLIKGKKQQS